MNGKISNGIQRAYIRRYVLTEGKEADLGSDEVYGRGKKRRGALLLYPPQYAESQGVE